MARTNWNRGFADRKVMCGGGIALPTLRAAAFLVTLGCLVTGCGADPDCEEVLVDLVGEVPGAHGIECYHHVWLGETVYLKLQAPDEDAVRELIERNELSSVDTPVGAAAEKPDWWWHDRVLEEEDGDSLDYFDLAQETRQAIGRGEVTVAGRRSDRGAMLTVWWFPDGAVYIEYLSAN